MALCSDFKICSGSFEKQKELGNGIYVSISKEGSDTPVTRPETDKAGQSPRDRKNKRMFSIL